MESLATHEEALYILALGARLYLLALVANRAQLHLAARTREVLALPEVSEEYLELFFFEASNFLTASPATQKERKSRK